MNSKLEIRLTVAICPISISSSRRNRRELEVRIVVTVVHVVLRMWMGIHCVASVLQWCINYKAARQVPHFSSTAQTSLQF
jgi:cell division protein FtsB